MRIWIMDEDATPQRFPLQRLFRQVIQVTGTTVEACSILRARGYGPRIRQLEEQLDTVEAVSVPISELDQLSAGTDEWFYDLDAEIPGTGVRFGLHDSSALFVEGEQPVAEAVAATFSNYRRARVSGEERPQ